MTQIPKVPYVTGWRGETDARKILRSQGFYVMRSAGSKGVVDLIALKDGVIKLIQCKVVPHGMRPQFNKEREEFSTWPGLKGFVKEFWIKEKRGDWSILPVT